MSIPRTLVAFVAVLLAATPTAAQEASLLTGTVLHAETGEGVPDAIVRIAETNVSAVSDASGRFVLRGLPVGLHVLEVRHPELGRHSVDVRVNRPGEQFAVTVRVSTEGMSIELLDASPAATRGAETDPASPIPVTITESVVVSPPSSPATRAGTVLAQDRIRGLAGGSQNLGDLIRRAVPSLQVREADAVAGGLLCLEFRGASSRSLNVNATVECNDPQIYLDGIPLTDPTLAYTMTTFEALEWIQVIPPGEAGAQFGSSTNGVIVIATTQATRMGMAAGPSYFARSRRTTFDWEQDPNGHNFFRTFLGAAVGNAIGLAGSLEVGRRCIYIEDRTREIETSCARAGVAGVSVVAFTLPALGSALGAHWGGATDTSVGRWVPALIGASMAIFPGYVYSLTTVGDGVAATNGAGKAILLVGTPLLTTLADRLYRKLRAH